MKIIIGCSLGIKEDISILKNNINWFETHKDDIDIDLIINSPIKRDIDATFINKYKSISESRMALFEEMKSFKGDAYLILDPDINLTINTVEEFINKIVILKQKYDFINLSYTGDSPIPALFTLASSLNDLDRQSTIETKRIPSFYDLEIGKSEYQVCTQNQLRHTSVKKAQFGIQVSRSIYTNTKKIRTEDYVSGGSMVYFNSKIFHNYLKEWDIKNRWFDTANTRHLAKKFKYAKTDILVEHQRNESKMPDIEEAISDINGMSIALDSNRREVLKQLLLSLYYIKGYETKYELNFSIDKFIRRVKEEILSFKQKKMNFKEFKWIYNLNNRKGFANWKLPIRYSFKNSTIEEVVSLPNNSNKDLVVNKDYIYINKKYCALTGMFSYSKQNEYISILVYAEYLKQKYHQKILIEADFVDPIKLLENSNIEKNRFNNIYTDGVTYLIDAGNEGVVFYSEKGNLRKSIKKTTTIPKNMHIAIHELDESFCVPKGQTGWAPTILNDKLSYEYTWVVEYEDIAIPIFDIKLKETIYWMKNVIQSGHTIKDIKLGNLARDYRTNKIIFNDFGKSISRFDSKNDKHIEWTRSIIRQLFWIINKKEFNNHCNKKEAIFETCIINNKKYKDFEVAILGDLSNRKVPKELEKKYGGKFKCHKEKE